MNVLLALCVALAAARGSRDCPELMIDSCHCTAERSKQFSRQSVRVKAVCDDADLTETMQPSSIPNTTVSLILSNNKISALKNNSFLGLRSLERLDLSSNLISRIAPGAFHGLTALRRLDLSNNRIGCFSADMFLDLGCLSKLNLSGNIFSTLPEGLFTHVPSLRALHVGTDYLFCDCQLRWLLSWIRSQAVRVGNESVCVYPTRLHGLELRSLQEQQLTCDGPLELPVLQLIPTQRQLVFRGDRLPLQCAASFLDPTVRLSWSHEQRPVHTLEHRGLYVEDSIIHDCCLITSELILSNIDAGVSGNWQCHVTSSRGNSSIGMEIVVLETTVLYCGAERVSSNKGDFRWPKTLAGFMAFLPCAVSRSGSAPQEKRAWSHSDSAPQEKRAWRRCDRTGRWAEHDYNQCSYTSQFTRSLHELTQMSVNVSSALMLALQLSSLTSRAALFGDVMDVIFVTHLVERLTRLVDHVREVSVNIALEALLLRPDSLMGLLCTVEQRLPLLPQVADAPQHNTLLNFRCHTLNVSGSPVGQLSQNTVAIASIHFPLATPRSVENCTCKLQLIVFRNGKLFPCTGNSSNLADDGKRRSVSTPVAFTKLDGCSPGSPVQPVTVALRHFSLGVDPTAAYWDFDLLDGHGGWRAEGCHITGSAHNTTTIHCAHHNNLAVLMVRVSRSSKSDYGYCGGAEPMKHGEHVNGSAIVLILLLQGRMV
ncbi:adhesion G protein-coupled receptor A3-like [Sinocyclocheilus anshuiensis]|uniref:adhesion G protein-coupled receptor A3-like n=1 Tax=Sinocyclocheilus anshuiensis TaxID=1608454 RepID=UPI0007BAA85C|nr:PREDICTED: adhesion G protein-coupled receptor A3-like [Sinocyclocheilus anshuiensis]